MSIKSNFPKLKPTLNLDFANSKSLDPRITFSRASAASYYDGKTYAKAEENLFVYSQDFGNAAWSGMSIAAKPAVTTDAVLAPDGTLTADALNFSGQWQAIGQGSWSVGVTYTYSIWLRVASGSRTLNLVSLLGSTLATFVITDVWTRFTVTTTSSNASVALQDRNAADFVTVYAWGAQLEQRSQATAYTPTIAQPITNYIPALQTALAGVPRFDHDPLTGESLGLLIEEQRTNLLTYSEQFDNAVWTKTAAIISTNNAIAPDGTATAEKLIESASTGFHYVGRGGVGTIGNSETLSVYAKAGERSWLRVELGTGTAWFDLTNGSIGSSTGVTSAAITYIGNGWYRCSVVATRAAITTNNFLVVQANNGGSYVGDGYSGVYIWGAQLEAGAFPTSYIKTEASQVTRVADSASMLGVNFSSWYRRDEGTLFAEASTAADITAPSSSASGRIDTVGLSDGSVSNTILIGPNCVGGSNILTLYSASNGTAQCQISSNLMGIKTYKLAAAMALNSFALSVSGSAPILDLSGIVPDKVDRLLIGNRLFASPTQQQNGCIRRIAFYPKRLTDTQLQALTT